MSKNTLYLILAGISIIALITANELGYGIIAFVPLALLAVWLIDKAFK